MLTRRRAAAVCAATALLISVAPGPSAPGGRGLLPLRGEVVTALATRGPLRQTVRLRDFLESADKAVIRSGCQWPVQLADIVPEGTRVEAGDVVARLNTAGIWPHEQRTKIDYLKIRKWGPARGSGCRCSPSSTRGSSRGRS